MEDLGHRPLGGQINFDGLHSLHYGRSRAPLARIVADDYWPSMWRIVWPDGRRSDLVNLDRAKDAAAAIAERGPPARNRRLLHWKKNPSKTAPEAPPIGWTGNSDQMYAEIAE